MTDWHVNREGRLAGPFSEEQIREFATVGRLVPTDLVRRTGDSGWRMAQTIEGLFPAQPAPIKAPPPHSAAQIPSNSPSAASDLASNDRSRVRLAAQAFGAQKWAGFWQRLAANVVDGAVLLIPTLVVVSVSLWALRSGKPATRLQLYAQLFCVNVIYHTLFLASSKVATPGRIAAGIAIVDADTGEPIPPGRALMRSALSWLGYLLILPNLVMLFTQRRQTIADLIARTVAVRYKISNTATVLAVTVCGAAFLAGLIAALGVGR